MKLVVAMCVLLCYCRGALEAYAKSVSAKGGTTYAPVYPIMQELLLEGLTADLYT